MRVVSPTPVSLLEAYFDNELNESSLAYFDEVTTENWIEFAKYYLSNMTRDFESHFLEVSSDSEKQVRLYFEPRLASDWEDAVVKQFSKGTPLLGLSPYPAESIRDRKQVAAMLAPLNKHLLFAHSLFFRDNFYYCFDMVADSVDSKDWKGNPTARDLVQRSVTAIRQWLPILVALKSFIESGVLVFMPYYVTPSFPYGGSSPNIRESFEHLRITPREETPQPGSGTFDLGPWDKPPVLPKTGSPRKTISEDDVLAAWLNARLMGLDVVFPDQESFDFGKRLYFDSISNAPDAVSSLMSIENLPFGNSPKSISLEDLWKIRREEAVFNELRNTVSDCKAYLEENVQLGATNRAVTDMCRTFLGDELLKLRGEKALRVLEGPSASVATSVVIGVGVSVVTANPAIGITVGAAANPSFVRMMQNLLSRKRRAIAQLQALL